MDLREGLRKCEEPTAAAVDCVLCVIGSHPAKIGFDSLSRSEVQIRVSYPYWRSFFLRVIRARPADKFSLKETLCVWRHGVTG